MALIDRTYVRGAAGPALVAVCISTILLVTVGYFTDPLGPEGVGYLLFSVFVAAAYSMLAVGMFAVPLLLILMRLRWVNLWSALASGAVTGAAMAASMLGWPQRGFVAFLQFPPEAGSAVYRIEYFAAVGTVSALGFWVRWKRREKGNEPSPFA